MGRAANMPPNIVRNQTIPADWGCLQTDNPNKKNHIHSPRGCALQTAHKKVSHSWYLLYTQPTPESVA
jgi:hypothetical protein